MVGASFTATFLEAGAGGGLGGGTAGATLGAAATGAGDGVRGQANLLPKLFQQLLLLAVPLCHTDELARKFLDPSVEGGSLGGCGVG